MPTEKQDALPPIEKYQSLLEEAKQIQGVSLSQDAWRRLRKNRTPMYSLYFLIVLSVLAVLTPLLPMQSHIEKHIEEGDNRIYEEPTFFHVDMPRWQKLREQPLAVLSGPPLGLVQYLYPPEESEASQMTAKQRAGHYDRRVDLLFNSPNWFDELLIRTRVNLFGDYTLPSLLGTDGLGRDLLAQVFWGARISLIVGLVATLVSLVIGVTYGAISGFLGGWVDDAMMRFVDVLYSIPFIFVVIFVITILNEPSIKSYLQDELGIDRIFIFFILIGAIYWLTMARVVRGQIISLKQEQFVEAARTIGAGQLRIIFRHLVPNVLSVIIVYLTLTIPSVMLFEAFLSFLGLGVEAPDVSWGLLANEGIKVITPIKTYWWLVVFPGLALAMTLFALNFLGDGLRDALDPRLKNR